MRKASFIFFVLVFSLACSDEQKIPNGILKQKKMQAIMWDMVRAGDFLNNFVFNIDTSIDKSVRSLALFDTIYHIHNVTRIEFEKSYDYYRDHPVLLKTLMDSLGKKYAEPEIPEQPSLPDSTGKKGLIPENRSGMIVPDSSVKAPVKKRKR